MSTERLPQCILANGECPRTCKLYTTSRDINTAFAERGATFNPQESRLFLFLTDASNQKLNVAGIAQVIALCENEPR